MKRGAVKTLRAFVCLAAVLVWAGCEDEQHPLGPGEFEPTPVCLESDGAFVREATLALLGRRPLSEQEVRTAASLIGQIDALNPESKGKIGRSTWAQALMGTPEFVTRWQELLLDALQVPRADGQALVECYGATLLPSDDAKLASYVRDHAASDAAAAPFTFLDLLRSSLVLDDLSPIYRAHLFAMLTKPNQCGNVDPVQQELVTRQEVGHVFDAAYTNRDQVCLACHNSESSVTFRPSPQENRHFPIRARLEEAVFGASTGVSEAVPHAVFRTADFLTFAGGDAQVTCGDPMAFAYCADVNMPLCDDGSQPRCASGKPPTCDENFVLICADDDPNNELAVNPWGADPGCGTFARTVPDDPAKVDAFLASVHGKRATVFEVEQALSRGVDSLAKHGLVVDKDGRVADRDAAFAYLVALNIVDLVWREVMGSPLTISTRFPRSAAAHDVLEPLTNHFVAEHFSLKTLLTDILMTPYFSELGPEGGCGEPYSMPAIFNPWAREEPEAERRNNSAADGVHPLSARTLMSSTYAALGWPAPPGARFPGLETPGNDDDGMMAEGAPEQGSPVEGERGGAPAEPPVAPEPDDAGTLPDEADGGVEADAGSPQVPCTELSCQDALQRCFDSGACCEEASGCMPPDMPPPVGEGGDDEVGFQRGIGVFLGISQKGFRGLDLSARLVWEERFGACTKPEGVARDALDDVLGRAIAKKTSLFAVVLALKDRMIGEARLDGHEVALLERLLGASLAQKAALAHEPGLRLLCGALLSSPEHLLAGLPTRGGEPPELGPSAASACTQLSTLRFGGHTASCEGAKIVVHKPGKAK